MQPFSKQRTKGAFANATEGAGGRNEYFRLPRLNKMRKRAWFRLEGIRTFAVFSQQKENGYEQLPAHQVEW